MKQPPKGLTLLDLAKTLIAMLGFASAFPVTKVTLNWVQPITLATLRTTIAAIAILPVFLAKSNQGSLKQVRWTTVFAFGFFTFYASIVLQNYGLSSTTAGLASILQSSAPIFMAILAFLYLGESLTAYKALGSALALAGVVLLTVNVGFTDMGPTYNLGNLLMILSAVSIAAGNLFAKLALAKNASLLLVATGLGVASLLLVPTALLTEPHGMGGLSGLIGVLGIFYLALISSVVSNLLIYDVLSRVDLSKLAFFGFLVPVFANIISAILLGEVLSPYQVLLSALVIAGVTISQKQRRMRP